MSLRTLGIALCAWVLLGSGAGLGLSPAAAQDEDALELDEPESAPAAEPQPEADAPPPKPAEQADDSEAPPKPEKAPADTGARVLARASVGGGLGTRSFRRPVAGGAQELETTLFPAIDFGISVRVWPEDSFSLDVLIRYQTSLGLVLDEDVLFALPNEVAVRSDHAELSVAPGFRFGGTPTSPRLLIPVGVSFRSFWPAEHHLQTPRYVLIGPHVRLELELMFGRIARLSLGPELQVYGIAGTDLTDYGVHSPGLAYGGQVSLEFRLTTNFLIEISYRQSNATSSSDQGPSFQDVERFATVRFAGEM